MKYLVTGSGGQLGQEWVSYLKINKLNFSAFSSSEMDITNPEQVREQIKIAEPNVVINCAAYTNVDGAEEIPDVAFKVNTHGAEIIAKECRRYRAKLVHYSTDYVFPGREKDAERYPNGYPEDANSAPVNVYGKSKKEGEDAIIKFASDWLIIRVSWLCGRYGNNFLKTMLRLGKERDKLDIVNDQLGTPSFCHDVVDKTVRLIELEQQGFFHVTSEGEISWFDFAEKIFELEKMNVACNPVSSEHFPAKATRPKFSLLNTTKMRDIGIEPIHWEKGTSELLQQLKKHS